MIDMDGFTVKLTRKRIKNLNLRITATGDVNLSAPLALPLAQIHSYLQEKRDWIDAHRSRMQARPRALPLTLTTGEHHLFLGRRYELMVYAGVKQRRIEIDENNLHLFVGIDATLAEKNTVLQNWYRQQMQSMLPELIKKWEAVVGVQVNAWGIKAMKTRWGSCNTVKKRIWLNLSLMQKPLGCLESVIVHELVHLLEPSHNQRFYALMSQFMPDWKRHKQVLRNVS